MVNMKVEKSKDMFEDISGGSNKLENSLSTDKPTNEEEFKVKKENNYSKNCLEFEDNEFYEVYSAQSTTTINNEESLNCFNQQLIRLSNLEKNLMEKQLAEFKTKETIIETLFKAVSKETEQKFELLRDIEAKNATIYSLENQLNLSQLKQSKEEQINENYKNNISENLAKIFELEKTISDMAFQLTRVKTGLHKESNTLDFTPLEDIKNHENKTKNGNKLQHTRQFLLNLRNHHLSKKCPEDLLDLESYKIKTKLSFKDINYKMKPIVKANSGSIPCRNGNNCNYGSLCTFSHDSSSFLKHTEIQRDNQHQTNKRKGDEALEGLEKKRKLSSPECCDICSFFTYRKGEIKKHKLSMHLDTFITCEDCGKLFTNDHGLGRHKKQIHPEYSH